MLSGQSWAPQNGANNPQKHYTAFTHANLYLGEGKWLSDATLLIRENRIEAIGKEVEIPANAIVKDVQGKFIYPSFIDLYTEFGISKAAAKNKSRKPQLESKKEGPFYWSESVKPEVGALNLFHFDEKEAKAFRKEGFGAVLSHQQDGVIRGTSSLIALTEEEGNQLLLDEAAMQYSFFKGVSKQTYPTSLMGIIALIRQAHYDAQAYVNHREKTDFNRSLEALNEKNQLPKIIAVGSTLSELRADEIANEFDFDFIIKGVGKEYERIDAIKAMQAPLIVPVNYPKPYAVSDPYDAMQLPLAKMKEWALADENLAYLEKAQIPFTISATDLKKKGDFLANVKRAVKKGLSHDAAVYALSLFPAKLIQADSIIGKLEKNYRANFILVSDTLFKEHAVLISNWVEGKEYQLLNDEKIDLRGNYSLNVNKKLQFDLVVEGELEKLKAKVAKKGKPDFESAKISLEANRINLWFRLEEQLYRLSGVVSDSLSRIWTGKTIVDEGWVDWAAIKKGEFEGNVDSTKATFQQVATTKITYPNMAFGWDSLPQTAETIIFRNATVWTNEEDGILRNHDVVIHEGKIKMVGYKIDLDIMFPELKNKMREIDATDLHLTSGIIDEHSHIAISRGVNEAGKAITAEVSIGDVVNADDINIYRQLAGGVTASQLLHGSANPIGGQSALIKLRWGQTPEKMKIQDADGFIKFALGENVKQSNWGDHRTVRFPQTRMGVEQVFYDGFIRAKEYQAEWEIYNAKNKREKRKAQAPRIDLELEALSEILDTQRFITCHSYIQSEINMLMHVADSMKFRVNTFTHILEGYKVAEKLKAHGAAASTFSDWWAYKFEVNDAIPYNGAILHNQGVLTAFNSDDAEMGRRLNQEAAKAMKYGGVSAEEAWKFVTLNPAKMLHLDHRMGSIAKGKDADLVLWSDHPLSVYAKVKQTYIDGICYYDEARDKAMQKQVMRERERLISLMLEEEKAGKAIQKVKEEKKKNYECNTLEP